MRCCAVDPRAVRHRSQSGCHKAARALPVLSANLGLYLGRQRAHDPRKNTALRATTVGCRRCSTASSGSCMASLGPRFPRTWHQNSTRSSRTWRRGSAARSPSRPQKRQPTPPRDHRTNSGPPGPSARPWRRGLQHDPALGDLLAASRSVAERLTAPPQAVNCPLSHSRPQSSGSLWSRVRKKEENWRLAGAGPRVLRWIRRGVPCSWNALGPPKPFNRGVSCVENPSPVSDWCFIGD